MPTFDELFLDHGALAFDRQLHLSEQIGSWAWQMDAKKGTITFSNVSRACEPSSRYSDSGVVTRMSPGSRACCRRSCIDVSPVRTSTRGATTGCPASSAVRAIPRSGARRLRSTSYTSALSGET